MGESKTATAQYLKDEILIVCPHCGAQHFYGNPNGEGWSKVFALVCHLCGVGFSVVEPETN